jgi:hypothetical protein
MMGGPVERQAQPTKKNRRDQPAVQGEIGTETTSFQLVTVRGRDDTTTPERGFRTMTDDGKIIQFPISLKRLVFRDAITIPPRPWLMRGLLLRKQVTSLIAAGGIGKSIFGLIVGMHLAAGRDFGPFKCVNGPYRVAVLSVEEDADELERRFEALRVHFGFTNDEARNLFIINCNEEPIIAAADRRGVVTRTKFGDELERQLFREAIDVVIIDPFIEIWDGDENSNPQVKGAAAIIRRMIRRMNAACLLMHHVKKGGVVPGDIDAGRGASSLAGLVRLAHTLTNMSKDEAKTFGLDKPAGFIRLDRAKGNYLPPGEEATWFQLQSVEIGNADPAQNLPSDLVGVVAPWTPPKAFEGVTTEDVNRVLDLIEEASKNVPYSRNGNATDRYVITLLMTELGKTEAAAKTIFSSWWDSELIVEKTYPQLSKGKGGKGLIVDNSKRPDRVVRIF